MNFGFNSNVNVGGTRYHVQSEDHGPANPFFDTVVYRAGRVVHKRRSRYPLSEDSAVLPDAISSQKLHEWLAQQHREVISQLESGALQLTPSLPAALQIELLNPESWLAHGHANLQVQVKCADAAYPYGETTVSAFLENTEAFEPADCFVADEAGRAALNFALPKMADGATLVIQARGPDAYGELRFRLHARRKSDSAPALK